MTGSFAVSALAVREGDADAVGVVRLACEVDGLVIELVRAGMWRPGFVPAALATTSEVRVPYRAIRGLVHRGRWLMLSLDPALPIPFHRLALGRFSEAPAEVLTPIHRWHGVVRAAAWAVPPIAGAVVAATIPTSLASGAFGRGALAIAIAWALWMGFRAAANLMASGGPASSELREALEAILSERLALTPLPGKPRPVASPVLAPEPSEPLPWARWLGAAALVATSVVVLFAVVATWRAPSAPPASEGPPTAVLQRHEPTPTEAPAPPPSLPRCTCERHDSSLWRGDVPILTVLTTNGPETAAAPPISRKDEHDAPLFSYDVLAINNGAARLREVRIVLTYAERDARDRRVNVTDRGLYWGLPLAPGAAVKWSTEGPGTEVRIDPSETRTLAEAGLAAAPPDAFAALQKSKHRAARLHAAVMLAYHHDARAADLLDSIGTPFPEEASIVRRVRAAIGPITVCALAAKDGVLSACAFNATTKVLTNATLRELPSPTIPEPRAWPITAEIPVHDGVQLSWPLEGSPPEDVTIE